MFPLISIIVPVYNAEQYLDKCISSILNQTYKNLEIILVNDGSTDNSADICEKYALIDDRIKVVHKQNGGQSSARNMGLDICSGDYIGFVDSDDWISPTMYEDLLSITEKDKTFAIIGMQEISETGEVKRTRINNESREDKMKILSDILLHKAGTSVCTKLFSKDVIKDVRFNERRLNEDLLFTVAVIDRIEFVKYHSGIGYFYLKRSGSTSRVFGKAIHDMIENSKYIRQHVEELYPSLSKEAERFEICQHISFLLCCPYNYKRKEDPVCGEVLAYVRKNIISGLRNPYLSKKDKIKLVGVSLCPRAMSKLVEKKARSNE